MEWSGALLELKRFKAVRMGMIHNRTAILLKQKRRIIIASLAVLSFVMVGCGLYFKQYFMVFAFAVWLCAETLLLRLQLLLRWPRLSKIQSAFKTQKELEEEEFWRLYHEGTENAMTLAGIKLSDWLGKCHAETDKQWALNFRLLCQFKLLIDCDKGITGNKKLQRYFVFRSCPSSTQPFSEEIDFNEVSTKSIMEAAVTVSDMLLRVQKIGENCADNLGAEARRLIEKTLGHPFDGFKTRALLDRMTDIIQKEGGAPYLLLNLIRNDQRAAARELGKKLLAQEIECDEELRSTLYWIAELNWFSKEKKNQMLSHDEAIKFLYHLCFMCPDRAGFLEIDSQFVSELGPVNEIAEEGFLFKEALVESLLELWVSYEGWFDGVFQSNLEHLTGRKSKIYDERENWLRFWRNEKELFSREYLYVVEGNLCFSSGQWNDAKFCYEKALEITPNLRAALFNLLLVTAKLKDHSRHSSVITKIESREEWLPLALSSIGNSYLLIGNENKAEEYYNRLRLEKGWEKRVDFYISLFSFEHKMYEKAMFYAKKAHENHPLDSSMSFHLSRCYSVVGEKEAALEVFNKVRAVGSSHQVSTSDAWLFYYRFTLEKDNGRHEDAAKTLLQIPRDYFDEPSEFNEAIEFAKIAII